jgi:RNA methyltransferase, TrmH family
VKQRHAPYPDKNDIRVAGLESCRALFQHRRQDIRRVFVLRETSHEVRDILAWCAKQRLSYSMVSMDELAAIAETVRHDGICMFARKKKPANERTLLEYVTANTGPLSLVLLDGVKNPNNVGAIARVCSYFGVRYMLAAGETPGLSTAAMRTAQGGAEGIDLVPTDDQGELLYGLKKRGLSLIATSSHATLTLGETPPPSRAVFMFGSENAGLSPGLLEIADATVAIPGSGGVESLNIACAATVLLWEHWRAFSQGKAAPAPPPTAAKHRIERHPRPRDRR